MGRARVPAMRWPVERAAVDPGGSPAPCRPRRSPAPVAAPVPDWRHSNWARITAASRSHPANRPQDASTRDWMAASGSTGCGPRNRTAAVVASRAVAAGDEQARLHNPQIGAEPLVKSRRTVAGRRGLVMTLCHHRGIPSPSTDGAPSPASQRRAWSPRTGPGLGATGTPVRGPGLGKSGVGNSREGSRFGSVGARRSRCSASA